MRLELCVTTPDCSGCRYRYECRALKTRCEIIPKEECKQHLLQNQGSCEGCAATANPYLSPTKRS